MRMFRDRVPYSPITDPRRSFRLPGDARVAVWTLVNVEEWSEERAMPRTVLPPPYGQPLLPDLPNWAWHEYGMRVGFWRLLDLFKSLDIRTTLPINGNVCRSYRPVAKAALDAGWEFMGHGFVQRPTHHLEDQRKAIRDTIAAIRKFTGKAPRGWESPGLTETFETIDILADEGIEYVADWVLDDQPCRIRTKRGSVVSVPYTVEMNDIAVMQIQHHPADEWLRRGVDSFEELWKDGEDAPRVLAISMHPYISGVPHRIGYVRKLYEYLRSREGVLFCTGDEILDAFLKKNKSRSKKKK